MSNPILESELANPLQNCAFSAFRDSLNPELYHLALYQSQVMVIEVEANGDNSESDNLINQEGMTNFENKMPLRYLTESQQMIVHEAAYDWKSPENNSIPKFVQSESGLESFNKDKWKILENEEQHDYDIRLYFPELNSDTGADVSRIHSESMLLNRSNRENQLTLKRSTFTQIYSKPELKKDESIISLPASQGIIEAPSRTIESNQEKCCQADNSEESITQNESNPSEPSDSSTLVIIQKPNNSKSIKKKKNVDYGKSLYNVIVLLYAWHEFRKNHHINEKGLDKKITAKYAADELQFSSKSLDYYKLILIKYCTLEEKSFDIREYLPKSFGEFCCRVEQLYDPEKVRKLKETKEAKKAEKANNKKNNDSSSPSKEVKNKTKKGSRKGLSRPSAHGKDKKKTTKIYYKILEEWAL